MYFLSTKGHLYGNLFLSCRWEFDRSPVAESGLRSHYTLFHARSKTFQPLVIFNQRCNIRTAETRSPLKCLALYSSRESQSLPQFWGVNILHKRILRFRSPCTNKTSHRKQRLWEEVRVSEGDIKNSVCLCESVQHFRIANF